MKQVYEKKSAFAVSYLKILSATHDVSIFPGGFICQSSKYNVNSKQRHIFATLQSYFISAFLHMHYAYDIL